MEPSGVSVEVTKSCTNKDHCQSVGSCRMQRCRMRGLTLTVRTLVALDAAWHDVPPWRVCLSVPFSLGRGCSSRPRCSSRPACRPPLGGPEIIVLLCLRRVSSPACFASASRPQQRYSLWRDSASARCTLVSAVGAFPLPLTSPF